MYIHDIAVITNTFVTSNHVRTYCNYVANTFLILVTLTHLAITYVHSNHYNLLIKLNALFIYYFNALFFNALFHYLA